MPSREIALAGIAISGDRLRALRATTVDEIAGSFEKLGQMSPIFVRPRKLGFQLIAGLHRLEAARKLGWESVNCIIVEGKSADEYALMEIDENLMRADLTPAEVAAHMHARKQIYEHLYPETRSVRIRGGPGRGKKTNRVVAPSFIEHTAGKTNCHRATVARAAARGKAIPNISALAATSLDTGEELDALAQLYETSPQSASALVAKAKNGEAVSARTILKQSARQNRERELGTRQTALPQKCYGVIHADPPWSFAPWSTETGMDRAADNHYPTMTIEAIQALKVPAADDCALFLWTTSPMLPEALDVIRAWGFTYRSQIIWAKNRVGTGYWVRNMHEILLIATKGQVPAPAPGEQPKSLIAAPVGRHSQKPAVFRELIEQLFPNLPRLEMFARAKHAGWDVWGNEAP